MSKKEESKKNKSEKKVYIKPVIMPMEDVFTQIVPLSKSYCYTSSGR